MTIGLVAYAQEPSDYYIKYGADVTENHDSHYPIMVDVSNVCGEQQILNNIAPTDDATLKVLGIASGDELYDYPINDYVEPRVGTAPDAASWGTLPDGLIATWGSRDVHYKLHEVPEHPQQGVATLYAWKGERANIQAVLYSKTDQGIFSVRMTEWKKGGVATGINNAGSARFVNYVITDDFTSCGNNSLRYPTWLVADVIDQDRPHAVPAMETRPVWCTLEIPRNIEAGEYTTELEVVNADNQVVKSLNLNIVVNSHSLPIVADQKFHLDFWQQPYAISRYYGVERWSKEHLVALRPYLQTLGRAGQRVVSAILFYEPWGEQTHDLFDPMVQTTRRSDGTWEYDYAIFDKYVELCGEYGINKQINCFSMLPWDMSFRYFDEASNSYKTLVTTYESVEYRELWSNFLTAFKAHLQKKGWFEKTVIAVDERGEDAMLKAYEIANALGFKMALAGNYHGSLCDILHDMCVQLGQEHHITVAQLADRKSKNRVTTFYTSCANSEPNIYTNSYPAEAAYLPIYAAKMNLDGYLHWSWMNWDEDPLTDSRYRLFGSGDTYCYYPGNRSSVRFERLIEGIHQYEKIQILREEYSDDADKLYKLNTLLDSFVGYVAGEECAALVNNLEDFLNGKDVEISAPQAITVSPSSLDVVGEVFNGEDVKVDENTIKVDNISDFETPIKLDLYNTSKGDGVIPPYRIPGITTASNGRLITTAARLVCGTDPGYGQVDVVCRLSDDHGKRWSDMIEVAVGTGITSATVNYFDTAFGDPAVVADRTSDEVLIIAVAGCTVYANGNTTRHNPNMIATILSKDNGETWEKPINVTEDIYSLFDDGNPIQSAFIGGGKVFQSRIVKKGEYYRLYAAMCARPNGNRVIYSDDFGRTWHALGGASALPAPGGDEPKCEELPDGRVILSSRVTGGRIYNIYTYTNTLTAEGSWEGHVMSTFEGAGHSAGNNSTNGEMLIVPVVRNSDNSEMYLALQSLPTGSGRSNVGIFYKELADASDIISVSALAVGWDGFFEVTTKLSAYSSMDLQADNRIGFIYEETLTGWGRRNNPVSTSFTKGEGEHNFDGFDNIYVAYSLEELTDGAYSIKRNIDRRTYLRNYFTAITADVNDVTKATIANALDALSPEPTTDQIDNLYNIISVVEIGDLK